MSSIVLLCRLILVLQSAGPGVKSVQVVLSELSMRLFDLIQALMLCISGYRCAFCISGCRCAFVGRCALQ